MPNIQIFAMLQYFLRRLGWRRSPERASSHVFTNCGTLAVYAGDLMVRSDLVAELDTECGAEDPLRDPLSGLRGDRNSAL